MAKQEGSKTNLYLLVIISIVAIVGIVILVLNVQTGSVISLRSSDTAGQTYSAVASSEWNDCGNGEMVRGNIPCSVEG